jgi:hypothetical protein
VVKASCASQVLHLSRLGQQKQPGIICRCLNNVSTDSADLKYHYAAHLRPKPYRGGGAIFASASQGRSPACGNGGSLTHSTLQRVHRSLNGAWPDTGR